MILLQVLGLVRSHAGGSRRGYCELLATVVAFARDRGATVVAGFPLSGAGPQKDRLSVGTEPMFAARGFTAREAASQRRVAMRRDLGRGGGR